MTTMFEATEINGMHLANRFVRSATWEGMATDSGASTSKLVDLMARLAAGGVGLIVTGGIAPNVAGWVKPFASTLMFPWQVARHRRVTEAVHRHGKQLWFELDQSPHPLFHFGMTGGFEVPGGRHLVLATEATVRLGAYRAAIRSRDSFLPPIFSRTMDKARIRATAATEDPPSPLLGGDADRMWIWAPSTPK